ncbi:MAG: Nudix family hydrolase [Rudaea sp.]
MNSPAIHVVAGVLGDGQGRVLVAQRAAGKHLAGLWEFPGGKVDPGECALTALRRELHEELDVDIDVDSATPLICVPWRYADKAIVLDAYRVSAFTGVPAGREAQAIAWQRVEQLAKLDMPPPDRPIVSALRLPSEYAITPEPGSGDAGFLRAVERAVTNGVRLLQLRAKSIDAARVHVLARATREIAHAHGAWVLFNGDPDVADACGFDGLHLSSVRLMAMSRRPSADDRWLAASCHSEAEIDHANALGIDFGVLGPVMRTASHSDAAPLGWPRFAELATRAAFPVFALGGLSADDTLVARQHGAQGIAGISAFFPS